VVESRELQASRGPVADRRTPLNADPLGGRVTPLPESEFLFVCAEIAAAFVGFASVVAILGQRRGRDDVSLDAFRLRIMLEAGLLTVFAALLPVVLHQAGFGESTWRVSGGLTALIGIPMIAGAARRFRRAKTTPESRTVGALIGGSFLIASLVLLLATIGVPADSVASYFVALYIYLATAAIGLYRVVTSLLATVPH
jgi:hypothetical protein